ncbi:hypothetical protein BDV96DRAFT_209037 [Lophiotrema nucula]|uniref:Uncharacterized protein n=1 Tax=Lophiotrema nucula TaxID=690887 RepID=A0A6A5ZNN1_9PLEO|nr:hypothetical protein BDV96DRAFT_209037 [Lophiotrema nucula]
MDPSVVDVPTLRSILGVLQDSSFPPDQGMAGWITESYFDPPLADDDLTLTVKTKQDFTKLYEAYKRVRDLTNKTQEKWPFFRENGKAIGRGEAKAMTAATPEVEAQISTIAPEFVTEEAEVLQEAAPAYPPANAAPVQEATPEPKVVAPSLSPSEASSTARRALLAVESELVITNLDSRPSSRASRTTPAPAASKRNKRRVELSESAPPPRKRTKKEPLTPAPSRRSSRNKPNRETPEPVKAGGLESAASIKDLEHQPAASFEAVIEASAENAPAQPYQPSQPEPDVHQQIISPQTTPDPTSEIVLPTLELGAGAPKTQASKEPQEIVPKVSREATPSVHRQQEIVPKSSPHKVSEIEELSDISVSALRPTIDIVTVARIQTGEGVVNVELGPGNWGGNVDLILEYLSWKKDYGNADVGFDVFCNITRFARSK